MPSRSSECDEREPAGLLGQLGGVGVGADLRSPVNAPPPATTKLPDIAWSPGCLTTGSASPVSSDSSISSPSAVDHLAVDQRAGRRGRARRGRRARSRAAGSRGPVPSRRTVRRPRR